MMKKATPEEAGAVTFVFWDIKRFPVPPGFDARRVRPCIKQFLEKHGYSGPLTINAVGILSNVHEDILGALSSTGINLYFAVFGCSSLLSLMSKCIDNNPPPANIWGICDPVALPSPESGYNLLGPLSYSYSSPEENAISWISLILAESETLEEDTCSETDESASWFCLMGDPRTRDHLGGRGFESFSRHLSSQKHEDERLYYLPFDTLVNKDIAREEDENPPSIVRNQPKMATPEEAVAATSVFWDINRFPVPPGFDANLVSLCIKRFLEKYGYSGPLTITAVGHLLRVPDYILGALSSSGITLCHSPKSLVSSEAGFDDIKFLMSRWISKNPPPANILGICNPIYLPPPQSGYNLFRPYSYSSPQQDAILWESLILAESGALEEDTYGEFGKSASWFCLLCKYFGGQGFNRFSRHLSSRKHALKENEDLKTKT